MWRTGNVGGKKALTWFGEGKNYYFEGQGGGKRPENMP